MLEELAKKDTYWRKIAFNICKDRYLADDLVNEMYLKLHDCKKQINDFFVIIVIRNIFLDLKRKKGTLHLDDFYNLESDVNEFEVDDIEKDLLEAFKKLEFAESEILLESSLGMSLRDIEKEFNINYGYVYRKKEKAKRKTIIRAILKNIKTMSLINVKANLIAKDYDKEILEEPFIERLIDDIYKITIKDQFEQIPSDAGFVYNGDKYKIILEKIKDAKEKESNN